MESIKNYDQYNANMKKSLLDKIFFMDKIDAKVIVDYGCADGTLIHFLSTLFPEFVYIGFDIDEKMVEIAREKFDTDNEQVIFTTDWAVVEAVTKTETSAVILSSVIHEVYAYGTRADVDNVWKRVYSGFDYIVIRDMIPSITMDKKSDINDYRNVLSKADSGNLRDFENVWGSIEQNKNLVHFLLKYKYTDNWAREVRENYFPMSREEMISSIPMDFEIEFHEHFVLPYQKKIVREDFGITLKDNTHLKLILRRV